MFNYDVAIIGIGRVGLPLSLSLAESGFKVIGIDINEEIIQLVKNRKMPFEETGCDELIKRVEIAVESDIKNIASARNIIITVGTPLMSHIETDLRQITHVLNDIVSCIKPGHNLILRSTVAPGTTNFVKKYLEQKTNFVVGRDIFLSFCPERLAEGKALRELKELPQIIGAEDSESGLRARELFEKLTQDIFLTTYVSAELTKLFNNISRYIHFAVSNQFTMIADKYEQNILEIIHMSNYKYPRGVIAKPGLTAGTCLRKDFGMINEDIPYTDLLLSAWKINEFTPKFLIDGMKKRLDLYNKKVAVLGYTFKADTDDTRDSLAPKLLRYLERELPAEIRIHEPFLPDTFEDYKNNTLEEAVSNADIVYIATNHSVFSKNSDSILKIAKQDCWFVDIWGVLGKGEIFIKNEKGAKK
jgi:UDP-N-acetyl-D-mannosaminuronic acid dehydrogenase